MRETVKFCSSFFLIVIILFSLGCSPEPEYKKIDLSAREAVPSATLTESSPVVFRIAVASVLSPVETLKSYEQLVLYLGQSLHQPVELVQKGTYAEINDMVESRFVDLAFVCSLAYVEGNRDFGMELLVIPQVDGKTVYHSYIIVPAASDAENLEDLRGRTFAFTDPLSNSGRLAPTYKLYQMGETPDNFFGKYVFTYSHDNSITAVAENVVDGAAIDSLVYDYMVSQELTIGAKIRIIDRSPPFGIPPVVVNPALNQEIKARLRGLFLSMHEDEAGKEILSNLMIDRFVLGSDESYDSIRNMADEME